MKINTSGKLNLNLCIRNRSETNLHEIESLIVPINLFDEIDIEINSKEHDEITFKDNPELSDYSTVHKALECLRRNTALDKFFDISVNKRIPIQAGLGGGSSDAAAVLVGISKMLEISLPNFSTIVKGVGDDIENFYIEQDLYFLVIVPVFGISTEAVFQQWDKQKKEDVIKNNFYLNHEITIFNDTLEAAMRLEPKLKSFKQSLEEVLGKEVFMTGTGSSLFSIYDSEEKAEYAKNNIDIDNRLVLVTKKIDYSYKELLD